MPEILEGISRGGIFVVRDKGFINHVLEARKADRESVCHIHSAEVEHTRPEEERNQFGRVVR